jgi:predicted nucleotidyltransferase
MEKLSPDTLQEITRRLVEEFDPEQVILYGSHAWGEPHAGSDVDLLVVVSQSDERLAERARRAYRALRGLNVPTDVLVKTLGEVERLRSVDASLESRIYRRGRILYG